jgi:hypothetical protein
MKMKTDTLQWLAERLEFRSLEVVAGGWDVVKPMTEDTLDHLQDAHDEIEALRARVAALDAGVVRIIAESDGRCWDMLLEELMKLTGREVIK